MQWDRRARPETQGATRPELYLYPIFSQNEEGKHCPLDCDNGLRQCVTRIHSPSEVAQTLESNFLGLSLALTGCAASRHLLFEIGQTAI